MVQGGFRFKIFLSRAHAAVLLCGPGNFDRGHYAEYFCEIILKCRLRFSYLELWRPPKWEDRNHVGNFGRGHYEKHFYVIILIWTSGSGGHVVWRCFISRALVVILISGADPFRQFWQTALVGTFFWNYFSNFDQWFRRICRLKYFLSRAIQFW